MKDWRRTFLAATDTIRHAIEVIDASGLKISLVVDAQEHLLGTVTDGDVRRGLLRGLDLTRPVTEIMNAKPATGTVTMSRVQRLAIMRQRGLSHLPVLDASGRLINLESDVELLDVAEKPNWVVLMAGGLGQRLRPLTADVPKPLLPVGDRPLLEIIIERFVAQGFNKFYVAVNYRADMVEAHFGDGSRFGAQINYLRETEPLGTAGALGLIPERSEAPLIVMNGDLLTTVNFSRLAEFHTEQAADLTLCVRRYIHQIPYGVAEIRNDQVISIVEKPTHECFISGGIYVVSPAVHDMLRPARHMDMPELMGRLITERHRVTAFPVTEYWIDIGRIEDLERARAEIDMAE